MRRAALLRRLPGSPHVWLEKEIAAAKKNKHRDVETLQMLCAALERRNERKAADRRPGARPRSVEQRKGPAKRQPGCHIRACTRVQAFCPPPIQAARFDGRVRVVTMLARGACHAVARSFSAAG